MSRIVLIENDEAVAETLRCSLESARHEVHAAPDGIEGLQLARTCAPSLMLLALMLPGLNGLEICRRIRRESSLPMIMVTACTSEVDRILGLEMGADDYVTKPFSVRELLARVGAILRRTEGGEAGLAPSPAERVALGDFVLGPRRQGGAYRPPADCPRG
jgi:DNA-binding response OmpR family regulator